MIFFVLIKNTQGNLKKFHGPLGPPQKCPKNCIFSLFQHFLAFLDSLDTFWNYNLATLAYNLPPEKISWILRTKCVQENDFSSGFQNATKKPLHVKSQKFEFYISWRGLFKQLCSLDRYINATETNSTANATHKSQFDFGTVDLPLLYIQKRPIQVLEKVAILPLYIIIGVELTQAQAMHPQNNLNEVYLYIDSAYLFWYTK